MSDNVTPIRPTIGLSRMGQLRRFVAWEREHNPGKTHIAEWALSQIEALQAKLADTRARHAATERDACQLASRLNGLERVVQERDAEIDALQADARRAATDYQLLRDFADRETIRADRLEAGLKEAVRVWRERDLSDEDETEFDQGCEQTYDECARMVERLLEAEA